MSTDAARDGEDHYWHGGPRIVGDLVLPPSTTGMARVCDDDPWVYIARERGLALTYAATCNGWLYEVEPIGDVEQDPDSMLPAGDSMRCSSARIVRRFKPSRAEVAELSAVVGLFMASGNGGQEPTP